MMRMSEDEEDRFRAEEEAWMMLSEEDRFRAMEEEEKAWRMMSEEDRFRAMAKEGVDRSFDENLPIFRSEITKRLGEMQSAADKWDYSYALAQLDWAEGLEDSTVDVIKYMAGDRDGCLRGAAYFAAKEPALAETLRVKAEWSDTTIAEVVEIAAGARRLRGMCLKTLADLEEEDIVWVAAAEYLEHVATYTHHGGDSIRVYPYRAVADEVFAAVAAGAGDPGFRRFVEGFAERAARLRRGAAVFGGEDAAKLTEHAATVEALCGDTEAFLQKMVSSSYWRMWVILIGREAVHEAQTPMEDPTLMDDMTPLLCTSERSDGHDAEEPLKKRRKTVCF